MRSQTFRLADFGLVAVAVLLNAFALAGLVSGPSLDQSAAAFAQPYDDGQSCTMDGECSSTFCVDGVCCASACDGEGQVCNSQGVCLSPAQAPVMSLPFQWLAAGLVALISAFRIRRRLRS